jgi:hypothetical protein
VTGVECPRIPLISWSTRARHACSPPRALPCARSPSHSAVGGGVRRGVTWGKNSGQEGGAGEALPSPHDAMSIEVMGPKLWSLNPKP